MAVGLIVILMDYITMRPVGGSAGRARSPCSVGSVSDLIVFCQTMRKEYYQHDLMALDWVREHVLPTAMIRYIVVVLARSSSAT